MNTYIHAVKEYVIGVSMYHRGISLYTYIKTHFDRQEMSSHNSVVIINFITHFVPREYFRLNLFLLRAIVCEVGKIPCLESTSES